MSEARILLLEDDLSLGETILERLEKDSYKVSWAKSIASAQSLIKERAFDLLILDVGLPDGSGFDLAEELQGRYPLLFLTALNDAESRLRGYELGANEYIPKPFHFKELIIRIEKTLQIKLPKVESIFSFKDFTIDTQAMTVTQDGQAFYPSKRDFSVLIYLISNQPKVISREELLELFWKTDSFPTNRTIDNTILRIRHFFGSTTTEYIKSVRGIGYQWIQEPQDD